MIAKPNRYKLRDKVKERDIMRCRFVSKIDFYKYMCPLFNDVIYLHISIDKNDYHTIVSVIDNNGDTYKPFYNPELRHNNFVAHKVILAFNKIMDSMKIFEIEEERKMSKDSKVINIKYFTDKIDIIEMRDGGDWIDLRAAEEIKLKAGEFKLIPLGIAMQLPTGYEAHIVPRSSTYKNFGIIQTNHQAVIDESYCGDNDQWFYPAYALRDTVIHANDRICQFRIMKKQEPIIFAKVDKLGNKDRGGIGSTGKR